MAGSLVQQSSTADFGSPVAVDHRDLIQLAAAARGLDLHRFRRGATGGDHVARLLGRGMEFDEARPYQPGDDPRDIDWRVTARTGRPYTKVFREERERPVLFVLDLRQSMHFATRGVYKAVLAARIAAILAWAAERCGDRVGGFLFAEDYHREIAPRVGRRGVLALIHEICSAPVWLRKTPAVGDPDSAARRALNGVRKVGRSGSLIFVLSDGHHVDDRALTTLKDFGRATDVVFVHLYDRIERSLPPPGRYLWKIGHREPQSFVSGRESADDHRTRFETHAARLRKAMTGGRLRYFAIATDDDPVDRLTDLFVARS
ncbi:MAG: DUF58 domain-containing protein [Pseudomonadota bacterium]